MNSTIECKAFFMLADCRYCDLDIDDLQTQQTEKSNVDSQTEEASEIKDDSLQDDLLQDDSISNGEVQICDIGDYTLSHMARISFTILRLYMHFLQEAHPVRLRAMHIINCPPFLNKMVSIVKPFIHDEVFKMVIIFTVSNQIVFFNFHTLALCCK